MLPASAQAHTRSPALSPNVPRQSTIQHRTFEALTPYEGGACIWTPNTEQRRNLKRRGYLHVNMDDYAELTMLGRRALTEYRERHGITA